jgi:putative oxidoreductase
VKETFEHNARAVTLNLVRVVTGLLFWQHGAQKLFGWLGGRQVESLASLSGIAGVLEFFGGLLIIAGLFTRPVAFVLAGEMAVAYFLRHAPDGFWPIANRGELSALYSFLFLFFAAHGGGAFSVDGWLSRRTRTSQPATPGPYSGRPSAPATTGP